MPNILGLDLAPSHSGAVLVGGHVGAPLLRRAWFTTMGKQLRQKHPACSVLTPNDTARKKMDNLSLRMARCDAMLALMRLVWRYLVDHEIKHVHVVIEGYAVGSKGLSIEKGEVGAMARQVVWHWKAVDWAMREYLLARVDEFLGVPAHSEKPVKAAAALERYLYLADALEIYRTGAADGGPAYGDLIDAYTLAMMGHTELALRADTLRLRDIPEGRQREVWHKVTAKQQPVNLLSLPWTTRAVV